MDTYRRARLQHVKMRMREASVFVLTIGMVLLLSFGPDGYTTATIGFAVLTTALVIAHGLIAEKAVVDAYFDAGRLHGEVTAELERIVEDLLADPATAAQGRQAAAKIEAAWGRTPAGGSHPAGEAS
ncbi:hypothetical protein [Thermomonospora umbrina]|uniref:Uncharacterized protein n=1 Tax=Thermomonospora umbrina TaxID=111806 RepID=A0A3D9T6R1_9ACTN|nr:hypothetical protein [Thermomonospora umbrina]REF00365.1 hypothetical protein DFJ69_5897 [Thermomonospora umbrina]